MAGLESTPDMYDLRMSEGVRPLYDAVKKFIDTEVEPITDGVLPPRRGSAPSAGATARASSNCSNRVKDKAKEQGLWNFFLPDAETGEGLTNLDYAYIAVELGKNPLASESTELRRARHRQHGGARARRHARAEGEVARAAACAARSARPTP